MKWLKRSIWILLAVAISASIAWAYRPRPVSVEVAQATRGRMSVSVTAEAKTRVHDRYVVSAPLMGQLARIEMEPGDEVREGDVMAHIRPAAAPLLDPRARDEAETRVRSAEDARLQAQASVERARAAAQLAVSEEARQRILVERDSAPPVALERAEAESRARAAELASARYALQVAAHGVETARAVLGRLEARGTNAPSETVDVLAPASGRVLRVVQRSAGVVNAGASLLEVGEPSALEIVAEVLTEDAVRVVPGARVSIDQWGGAQPLSGHVRLVEPSAFTKVSSLGVEEQRVNVIIDLDPPAERWRSLGDGYRVETAIETWSADDVLRVPEGAVFRAGQGWAVFVVQGGRARRRGIGVGERNGHEVQVLRGLQAGERVIVHPADTIADGTRVTVR